MYSRFTNFLICAAWLTLVYVALVLVADAPTWFACGTSLVSAQIMRTQQRDL